MEFKSHFKVLGADANGFILYSSRNYYFNLTMFKGIKQWHSWLFSLCVTVWIRSHCKWSVSVSFWKISLFSRFYHDKEIHMISGNAHICSARFTRQRLSYSKCITSVNKTELRGILEACVVYDSLVQIVVMYIFHWVFPVRNVLYRTVLFVMYETFFSRFTLSRCDFVSDFTHINLFFIVADINFCPFSKITSPLINDSWENVLEFVIEYVHPGSLHNCMLF